MKLYFLTCFSIHHGKTILQRRPNNPDCPIANFDNNKLYKTGFSNNSSFQIWDCQYLLMYEFVVDFNGNKITSQARVTETINKALADFEVIKFCTI